MLSRLYRTEAGLEVHMATNYLGSFLLSQAGVLLQQTLEQFCTYTWMPTRKKRGAYYLRSRWRNSF
jgi:hypothetical protein